MNSPLRVFIVEDSKSMSIAIEKHIVKEFDDKVIVSQFDSVEQVLENELLAPDVMLLDHLLEKSLGVDSIRSILKKYKDIEIAVISGQNNIKVFAKAYSNGASEYIRKDALLFHKISDFLKLHLT